MNHPMRIGTLITAARMLVLTVLLNACDQAAPEGGTSTSQAPAAADAIGDAADGAHLDSAAAAFPDGERFRDADLTHRVIDAPNGTYGYEIMADGQLLIQQTNLPGQPGVEGCRDRAQAGRLAELVIAKLRAGQMPPTVNEADLKGLGILP